MKKNFLMVAGLCLMGPVALATGDEGKDSVAQRYAETIKVEDLSKHLHIIASDEFEGRETGEEGQKMAAEYIANHFKNLGLPPVVDGSYYQSVPLEMLDPNGVTIKAETTTYRFLEDFFYYPGFADQQIEVDEVVFAGYGISTEDYDDYANLDVKGKVVVYLDKEPYDKDNKSMLSGEKKPSDWTSNYRRKIKEAQDRGAKAVLVITENMEKRVSRARKYLSKPTMRLRNAEDKGRLPVFYVSERMGNTILEPAGKKIAKIKKRISKKKEPVVFTSACKVHLNIKRDRKEFVSENVLGYIEGTDLKNELVVITAHYDHVGKTGDEIFNGADDDGSGTVAVMELAEAFAEAKKNGQGPRRSVLIMTVTGEEKGLLGSKYYTEHPIFPLKNTVTDLNIDMIGRQDAAHADNPDYIYLIGSDRLSTQLHEISEQANQDYVNLELDYKYNAKDDPQQFYYRSDHYNFAKHDIPVIFYFNGTHEDYHKATDTVEKINFEKMEKISRLVFYTAWEVANRDERLKVDVIEE